MTFLNVVTFWSTIQSYCICRVYFWGVYFWEVLHCRCEWTQTQQAQYNEFVENGSKSWVLIRRQLVSGVKNTQSRAAQSLKEKGPFARGRESRTPLGHTGASFLSLGLPLLLGHPPYFGWSLLLYIPFFRSYSSYTCQSSMPILKCTSHRPFFLALCELLWPPSPCPGVTSTLMGSGC